MNQTIWLLVLVATVRTMNYDVRAEEDEDLPSFFDDMVNVYAFIIGFALIGISIVGSFCLCTMGDKMSRNELLEDLDGDSEN